MQQTHDCRAVALLSEVALYYYKRKKKRKKEEKRGKKWDERMEINDWFSCRFQYEVSGGEISTCLISSHQQSWHIHLRSRQAGSAPEWQVWCHANCCFTEDSVTCPWMTYLWHTQRRTYCQKVLIFTSSACFKLMSYWRSLLRLLEVSFSFETLCNLYNLSLLLRHWEYGQQAKKKRMMQ